MKTAIITITYLILLLTIPLVNSSQPPPQPEDYPEICCFGEAIRSNQSPQNFDCQSYLQTNEGQTCVKKFLEEYNARNTAFIIMVYSFFVLTVINIILLIILIIYFITGKKMLKNKFIYNHTLFIILVIIWLFLSFITGLWEGLLYLALNWLIRRNI